MKLERGQWRELVCMHSGMAQLLMAHWEEAVEQWRQHIVAYDTIRDVYDYSRARYYFNSYVKLTSPSGRALKEYLEGVQKVGTSIKENSELWE